MFLVYCSMIENAYDLCEDSAKMVEERRSDYVCEFVRGILVLTRPKSDIVAAYFGILRDAQSLSEIARDEGISKQAAYKRLNSAMRELRALADRASQH